MNYGELKTAVFSRLPQQALDELSPFEFGQAIDEAQQLMATILPAEAVFDLVVESYADVSAVYEDGTVIPLPGDYLKAESVSFATTRASDGTVVRHNARMVSPEEFDRLKETEPGERIASIFNHSLNLYPSPAPYSIDGPPAVKLVYRRRPRPYMVQSTTLQKAVKVHLRQDYESRHTFFASSIVDAQNHEWSHWGIQDEKDLIGGTAYIGGSLLDADRLGKMYVCRIVAAWNENGIGKIRLAGDSEIPHDDDQSGQGIGYIYPYCLVATKQVYGQGSAGLMAQDWESPDMSKALHHLIAEYAVGSLILKYDKQKSQQIMQSVFASLQAMGANLDYLRRD